MTQSTPERQPCGTCGKPCTVTAAGGIRHHFTENPDFQDGPDSRKCKGVGQPPASASGVALAEDMESDGPQCRLCKHPVQLTSNGRVRSHLTPEATPRPCPGGSDFPLGAYPDVIGTTDGLVASLARDCGHVSAGECYACAGVAVPGELTGSEPEDIGTAPWGVDSAAVDQPTMADQLRAAPLTEALERETASVGTVLDVMPDDMRTEAERFMAAGVPEQPTARHERSLSEGFDPKCGQCDTDTHRCPGCGTDVPHGTVACADCTARVAAEDAERQTNCTHPDGFRAPLMVDGRGPVPACEHCNAVQWFTGPGSETCTHPNGFQGTADDLDEDGQDRVVSVCTVCGAVDPEDMEDDGDELDAGKLGECTRCDRPRDGHAHDVGPDPSLPGCPHPETHRAGCGCPDDDYAPGQYSPEDDPQVRLGELDEGDYFIRRGTLMRITGEATGGVVQAVVMDGPHKGRTGELPNLGEVVQRVAAPAESKAEPDPRDVMGLARLGAKAVRQADHRDGWRTPADVLALMSEEIRGMDALRFNCADCGHPVTPLVEAFDLYGKAKAVIWVCEPACNANSLSCDGGKHQCRPDALVSVGDLEFGDHFIRRGTLMRCTSSGYGTVEAVVLDGPHAGRTGELKNPAEQVERTYCRHNWVTEAGPDGGEHPGPGCEYCGDLKDTSEETKECTDDRTQTQSPRSSAVPEQRGTTAHAPDRGSKPPTKASAPAVSQKSSPVTSSAPTAKTGTNGRSAAAMTTDQSDAAAAFLGSGQSTGASNQADAAAQFLAGGSGAHGEKETKRDRFGRYLIPHPDTGKEQAWTRATTFAKSISDTYALSQWGLRMALLGATVRPDIVQRAHGKHVKADKQLLDELTADLKNAAGDKVAANLGTSMHSFTEMADRAWHSPGGPRSVMDQIPPDCREMVETYIRLLEETGLEPVPHLIEFTTVVKQYGVAGTSDNCYKVTKPLKLKIGRTEVQLNPGEYVIGDKKTGKDLDYGWQEIVIQLAAYAQGINTAGVWDRHDEVWEPDPLGRFDKPGTKVRLDAGVVIHLPVDAESEKTPAVYGVDLESGWNAAVLCERVRTWRKVRNLAGPVMVSEAPETFSPTRPEPAVTTRTNVRPPSLKDRANNVTSKTEASAVWQDAKKAGLPDAEVDELVAVMQARLAKIDEPGG